jgi:flagellar basal-body rod modification protein FlgD
MSFISPIPTGTDGKPKTTGSMQSLGKNDFLQLLVTKLENQDPMKPMEDENFIAQLAQFATLEQMNNISEGITSQNQWSMLSMQSLNNSMAAGLIGKEVTASYSSIYVDSKNKPTISFTTDQPATAVDFTVKDSKGNVVTTFQKKDVGAGVNTMTWDGTDQMGNRVKEGNYTIDATATALSGQTFKPALSLVGVVSSILYRDGAAYLRVDGIDIPLGDVTAVGEKGSFSG